MDTDINPAADFEDAPPMRGRGRPKLTEAQIAAMPPERRKRHDAYMRQKYYDSLPPDEREQAIRQAQSQAGKATAALRRQRNKGGSTTRCWIKEQSLALVCEYANAHGVSIPLALYDIIPAGIATLANK